MKTKLLLATTILSTGLLINCTSQAPATENISQKTVSTANSPINYKTLSDPQKAAVSFIEHINYARIALAMKKTTLAKQHITQARNLANIIRGADTEQLRVVDIETGRIVYYYDTEHKYHYFPLETGPVKVKQISSGPFWADNDLAVTDADIVHLSLDLTKNKAEAYLKDAENAIKSGDLKDAGDSLAQLSDSLISVTNKTSLPKDKARDNIALARNFISSKNYDGARYSLKHADDALNEMQHNKRYKTHHNSILAMRKDVETLSNYVAKKDPTMIEKADRKLDIWLDDLQNWYQN